jgi:hypothetical protein
MCLHLFLEHAEHIVRGIAESRKTRSKLLKTCTQLDLLVRQIDLQIAQAKIGSAFKQSAEMTHILNKMVCLPETQEAAMQLGKEMKQASMAGEMMNDAMDQVTDQGDPEEQELAVRLLYNEIAGQIDKTAARPVPLLPVDPADLDGGPAAAGLDAF